MGLLFIICSKPLHSEEWVWVVFLCSQCNAHKGGIVLRAIVGTKLATDFQLGFCMTNSPFTAIVVGWHVMMRKEQEDMVTVFGKSFPESVEKFSAFLALDVGSTDIFRGSIEVKLS